MEDLSLQNAIISELNCSTRHYLFASDRMSYFNGSTLEERIHQLQYLHLTTKQVARVIQHYALRNFWNVPLDAGLHLYMIELCSQHVGELEAYIENCSDLEFVKRGLTKFVVSRPSPSSANPNTQPKHLVSVFSDLYASSVAAASRQYSATICADLADLIKPVLGSCVFAKHVMAV